VPDEQSSSTSSSQEEEADSFPSTSKSCVKTDKCQGGNQEQSIDIPNSSSKCRPPTEGRENETDDEISSIIVCKTNNEGKRKWDKIQVCLYCSAKRAKMARHLEQVHGDETEVAEIIALKPEKKDSPEIRKKKQKERNKLFSRLRKMGNFHHNTEVLKQQRGLFITEKRPSTDESHERYLFCEFCLGAYPKHELKKHMNKCNEKPSSCKLGRYVQGSASMFFYTPESASSELKSVLSRMLVDDISRCAKSDDLIIQYGNKMCIRLRKDGDQQNHISNKIRELARLVLETRKCCEEVSNLKDCLKPKNFGFVVEAATELSGWNEEEGCMETPSIGIKLGHSLKKCAKILKAEGIRNGMKSLKDQADDFTTLIEMSWNDEISRIARTELEQRKWNKPKLLPLTSDLQLLGNHLKSVISSSIIALGNDNTKVEDFRNLCTAVLSSVILFNRRRSGEPAKMEVNSFESLTKGDSFVNEEVKASLSSFERRLCLSFKRVEVRGKRGRRVPILLTREVENAINLLIKLRKDVGVNPDNPFIFPVTGNGSVKNIRGSDAIRKHVRLCNLKCPDSIYSTNLRKHVATLSQILNLEKNELEMLATFLGHDVEIHKKYYRLPENTLQLAKCSKLMLLMEKGGIGKLQGKTLDEIEVDLEGSYCYFRLSLIGFVEFKKIFFFFSFILEYVSFGLLNCFYIHFQGCI